MIGRRAFLTVSFGGLLSARLGHRSSANAASATPTPGVRDDGWIDAAAWLASRIGQPGIKAIALQDGKAFAAGHIPGAAQTTWDAFELAETDDAAVAAWRGKMADLFATLGVSPTDTVIAYDDGTLYAARIWWVLDQIGHQEKRLLSGGIQTWSTSGDPTDTGGNTVGATGKPLPVTPNEAGIATLTESVAALNGKTAVFVDAREPDEYAAGHIPGALNIPRLQNATDAPGRPWKTADELKALYQAAGIPLDAQVIPYCSTGVRSAATYIALRLAGYPNVSLFSGSWNEWSRHPDLPVTKGEKP